MKKIAIIILTLNFNLGFGQVEIPFFEQIAFDFYKDSLLTKFPVEKRIKIPKYTTDFHFSSYKFQVNECLTGELLTEGKELEIFGIYALEQMDFDSPTHKMNYENLDKKQFRIKKSSSNLNLRISQPYHKKDYFENFYVIISENYKRKNITYYLLIDKNGKIKNWCRKESEMIIIH
ncbi:hypothetical protein [uncultured Winogradskyella sp.]|uniref:hypothetical protein n=1 Tax=uncultured Winogradskyella sp. TaxID=395353 RepID=UPI003515E555